MQVDHALSLSRTRHLAWLAMGLIICTACITGARAGEPQQQGTPLISTAPEPLEVDGSRFTEKSIDWFDTQRQRPVPVKLYLPVPRGAVVSVPLVVFSHGMGGSRGGYSYLGQYLAANGFASLHVQHVGSDRQLWLGNPFGLTARLSAAAQDSEAIHRVQDLRFALDQLLVSQESVVFDTQRIVAAGHSYGANTTMLIAGAQVQLPGQMLSLRDPRISAAILISAPPFYGMGSPEKILSEIDIPSLHITATEDVILIPGYVSGLQDRIDIFKAIGKERSAPKVLTIFKGGSHSIFTDRRGTGGLTLNPKVKIATRQLALAFLKELSPGNHQATNAWLQRNVDLVATFEKQVP